MSESKKSIALFSNLIIIGLLTLVLTSWLMAKTHYSSISYFQITQHYQVFLKHLLSQLIVVGSHVIVGFLFAFITKRKIDPYGYINMAIWTRIPFLFIAGLLYLESLISWEQVTLFGQWEMPNMMIFLAIIIVLTYNILLLYQGFRRVFQLKWKIEWLFFLLHILLVEMLSKLSLVWIIN